VTVVSAMPFSTTYGTARVDETDIAVKIHKG
jgi:hypothetical protein